MCSWFMSWDSCFNVILHQRKLQECKSNYIMRLFTPLITQFLCLFDVSIHNPTWSNTNCDYLGPDIYTFLLFFFICLCKPSKYLHLTPPHCCLSLPYIIVLHSQTIVKGNLSIQHWGWQSMSCFGIRRDISYSAASSLGTRCVGNRGQPCLIPQVPQRFWVYLDSQSHRHIYHHSAVNGNQYLCYCFFFFLWDMLWNVIQLLSLQLKLQLIFKGIEKDIWRLYYACAQTLWRVHSFRETYFVQLSCKKSVKIVN